MKQLIILVAVMILAATEVYAADFSRNINVPSYNLYLFASNSTEEFFDAESYFDYTLANPVVTEENSSVNTPVNENALQSANTSGSNEEESDEVLFDGSAGAMGIGIF